MFYYYLLLPLKYYTPWLSTEVSNADLVDLILQISTYWAVLRGIDRHLSANDPHWEILVFRINAWILIGIVRHWALIEGVLIIINKLYATDTNYTSQRKPRVHIQFFIKAIELCWQKILPSVFMWEVRLEFVIYGHCPSIQLCLFPHMWIITQIIRLCN